MQIDYPFKAPPESGVVVTIAEGIAWLRMALPFALDHINLWLLEEGDGHVAVDTGIAVEPIKSVWKSVLAERRLTRQIVTHFHPDHLGLAAWLEAETGAPLWMTQGEFQTAHLVAADLPPFHVGAMVDFFREHGLGGARLAGITERGNAYKRLVPAIPSSFHRLRHGDTLRIGARDWRVMVGYGHAPEHASLYCETLGVLISGDMLLPRISTNISAFPAGRDHDPLGMFLDSLDAFIDLPEDTLVLPSHGLPFRGIHARVAELRKHHEDRCADLLAACAEQPRCAGEVIDLLFGRPIDDPHQAWFATGEAIAHLNYLEHRGRLRRVAGGDAIRFVKN
ncbi:MAG: MBL fold metallo-hydrolase [Rhodocyclaceae bacterium]|nr:MBL fold metallo-hydrolase [Rhodocyclaceae bacterium]